MNADFSVSIQINVTGVAVEINDQITCEVEFDYQPAQRGSLVEPYTEPLPEAVTINSVMLHGLNIYPLMDRDAREELACQILQFLQHTGHNDPDE